MLQKRKIAMIQDHASRVFGLLLWRARLRSVSYARLYRRKLPILP